MGTAPQKCVGAFYNNEGLESVYFCKSVYKMHKNYEKNNSFFNNSSGQY